MLDLRYPQRTGYGVLSYKGRYPLVLDCIVTFLRCIRMVEQASNGIYMPVMIITVLFLSKTTIKFHAENQIQGILFVHELGCPSTRRYIHCYWSALYPFLDV